MALHDYIKKCSYFHVMHTIKELVDLSINSSFVDGLLNGRTWYKNHEITYNSINTES